jgi:CTP synthase
MTSVPTDLECVIARDSKIIFITGGVCSSLGKGVLMTTIGVLLKKSGYSVSVMKWDAYLNVDPGTMSPSVHGEVFVTADGAETDLDLGHYERHLEINLTRASSLSAGQIYQEILTGERDGRYLGKDIQLVPHVVDVVKRRLLSFAAAESVDFVLVEIGGTVGDVELELYLEAVRQLRMELGSAQIMHGHLSYVPCLSWSGDVKTKPTKHSVMGLKRLGLQPDMLFLRTDKIVEPQQIKKLAIMCSVSESMILHVLTHNPIYGLFEDLDAQHLIDKVQSYFKINQQRTADLTDWKSYLNVIRSSKKPLPIGLVAKYLGNDDPYMSVVEALRAAAYHAGRILDLVIIPAEALELGYDHHAYQDALRALSAVAGIVVPGGFDKRGVEGKICAARFAREHNVPYLGLCLGMQVMIIEAARSLLRLPLANSLEFDAGTIDPVIALMEAQRGVVRRGATMRLGSYACTIKPTTKAFKAYGCSSVVERHRHRFEVNNAYRERLEAAGLIFSGINPDLDVVEITEVVQHPFMLGVQFHPEFTSRPLSVNPLFQAFVEAACAYSLDLGPTLQVVGQYQEASRSCAI